MITYLKNAKAKRQKRAGIMPKINWYILFVGTLGFVEFILNFFGLQHLGGENISNIFLLPISIALSLAMMFSAHYAGEALQNRLLKAAIIAFVLGILFLGIIAYIRFISDSSFILTLANLGFYGTIAYVSYLRAEHQPHFDKQKKIEAKSMEDAGIRSGIEREQKSYEHEVNAIKIEGETYAAQRVQDEFDFIENAINEAAHIIEVTDGYETHRAKQLRDIEKAAYNACDKNNYSN